MKKLISIAALALTATAFCQETIIPLEDHLPQAVEVDIDSEYFHPAASMYIHGDASGASNLVHSGLAQFPDNGKLLRLKELLDQQQEQNQDQNSDEDQQNEDQNQDQPDQDNQNDDEQNQDQQNDQDQNQQDQDRQDQPEPEQPQDQNQQQEPPSAEQMSQDEAERLMDAMKQDEETKRLQLQPIMGAPVKVDKDW